MLSSPTFILLCVAVGTFAYANDQAMDRRLASAQAPLRVAAAQDGRWSVRAAHNLSAWRSRLFMSTQKFLISKHNQNIPPKWERFDLFEPFISCPPGRALRRVGPSDDGGKWLCEPAALQGPCTVISLGSNMDFRFGEAILAETPCKVVTLDCTVDGKVLSDRHSFKKLCVSGSEMAAREPARLTTYRQLVYGLGLKEVDLLKIDVESFEFPVFAEWRERTHALPEQISVEIHGYEMSLRPENATGMADVMNPHASSPEEGARMSHWGRGEYGVSDLALFFFHMANLGYGIVSREDNHWSWSCAEFTLMRVEKAVSYDVLR